MKKTAKNNFYKRMVGDLLEKNQNQWYSQFKRLTNNGKIEKVIVDEISHLSDKDQAERIADNISAVSQEYKHLETEDIVIPNFEKSSIPHITVAEVKEKLLSIKTKKIYSPWRHTRKTHKG